MQSSKILARAILIASCAHCEQLDKGGAPYILHPIRMMMRLRTTDYELMAIAILHDVIDKYAKAYRYLVNFN